MVVSVVVSVVVVPAPVSVVVVPPVSVVVSYRNLVPAVSVSLVHVLFVVAVPPVHVNPSSFVQVEEQPSPI